MTDHKDKIHIDHGRMHEALAAGHGALASRITEAKRHMEAYELAWASAFERDVLSGGDHTRGYPKTERGRRRLAADRLYYLELVGATERLRRREYRPRRPPRPRRARRR